MIPISGYFPWYFEFLIDSFHLYGQVSINQIASDKKKIIFNLIKLYEHDPKSLGCSFMQI